MSNSSPHKPKHYRVKLPLSPAIEPQRRRASSPLPRLRWKSIFKGGLLIFFAGIVGLGGLTVWYARDLPNPEAIREQIAKDSTKIVDRTGEHILYEIYRDKKRRVVTLEELPPHVVHATIAIEDQDFYTHPGFDIKGIVRALYVDLIHGKRQGGSTITQQLVKNAILTPERTLTRKFKELILAFLIEQKFSKDEILQLYLNEIPYGSTAYGIEVAAQTFFGKEARGLTIDEAAFLAALPKAPTYYSPYGNNTDKTIARAQYILDLMVEQGYLSSEEAASAKQIDTLSHTIKPKQEILAPHFVFYVRELLIKELGERIVDEGGLTIVTSLDFPLQEKAEKAIEQYAEKNQASWGASNAALVAIDPKTGEIFAMVGSKDYFDDAIDGQVNVAIRPRQPGSSFKPLVYATGFEKGYTPDTVLHDVVTTFPTEVGPYRPHNYDLKERGPVTVRTALAGSLNIPAVKMIYLAGINSVLDVAEALGYTTLADRSRFGLALVLGGGEVTLLEHTNAFAAFANDGVSHVLLPVREVKDHTGKTILKREPDSGERVLSEKSVRWLTNILSDNTARSFAFGVRNSLILPDRPVAAKTGTTNDYKDAWALGYVPSLATGVWAGNNNNTAMKRGADGSNVAAPIWNAFMRSALEGIPVEPFPPPPLNDAPHPVLRGVGARGKKVKVDRISGKLATEWTPLETTEEKEFVLPHTILYYIQKDAPRGPAPARPADDPQFAPWEAAVAAWAEREGIDLAEAPTEFDDIHTAETKPSLAIISPAHNARIMSNRIEVAVDATARYPLKEIRFLVDGKSIGHVTQQPWNTILFLPLSLTKGFHELSATLVDEVEHHATATAAFAYDPATLLDLELTHPVPGSAFTLGSDIPVHLLIASPETISVVVFHAQDAAGEPLVLARSGAPTEPLVSFAWRPPSTGSFRLWAEIVRTDGVSVRTSPTTFTVQ